MKYEFQCRSCETVATWTLDPDEFESLKEETLNRSDFDEHDEECPCDCEDPGYEYEFNPEGLDVCYKGFQFSDKNYREKKYRKKRSNYLKKRQKEVHHVPELKPNYKGQRTEDWREAKNMAKKDAHPRLGYTYDQKIQQESD